MRRKRVLSGSLCTARLRLLIRGLATQWRISRSGWLRARQWRACHIRIGFIWPRGNRRITLEKPSSLARGLLKLRVSCGRVAPSPRIPNALNHDCKITGKQGLKGSVRLTQLSARRPSIILCLFDLTSWMGCLKNSFVTI
jgi:hypothetical protein